MQQLEMHLLFFLLLFLLPHEAFSTAAAAAGGCNRRCGGAIVRYPFGFSSGCHIQLSCNAANSTSFLKNTTGGMVPILSFNSTASTFRVPLRPSCSRSVSDAKKSLSGANYAVSSHTGLLVTGSCGAANSSCNVPAEILSRILRLRTVQCGNTTVTCIASTPPNATTAAIGVDPFLKLNVRNASCGHVLTAAVYGDTQEGTVSVEFGVAELVWWLNGTCTGGGSKQCVENATCHDVKTPSGASGYRCACEVGMDGDGFAAGDGCYRAGECF